jgi:hypothetical protein
MLFKGRWGKQESAALEVVMLSEINPAQKDKYHMIPLTESKTIKFIDSE